MMKILIITVGLPRSGKSTWAKSQNLPIVNPDSIRLAIHGQHFIELAEPIVWAVAKIMVRALFLAGHNAIILDATNTTKNARNKWKSNDWNRKYKMFDTTEDTCIQRTITSFKNQKIRNELVATIKKMNKEFQPVEDPESP